MIKATKFVFKKLANTFLSIGKYLVKCLRFLTPIVIILLIRFIGFSWWYISIPIIVWIVTEIYMVYLNKNNIGDRMPIPKERFTEELSDGEVVIETDRTQEMILYMADLEDYLFSKGFTDK